MEVITSSEGLEEQGEFLLPNIDFAVKYSTRSFFLLLDQGPRMSENDNLLWKIFRRGWAPFFTELEDNVRFSVKVDGSNYDVENITKKEKNENFWKDDIFSESLHAAVPDLAVFSMIHSNMDLVSKNHIFQTTTNLALTR
jgi:hypothetical protein